MLTRQSPGPVGNPGPDDRVTPSKALEELNKLIDSLEIEVINQKVVIPARRYPPPDLPLWARARLYFRRKECRRLYAELLEGTMKGPERMKTIWLGPARDMLNPVYKPQPD